MASRAQAVPEDDPALPTVIALYSSSTLPADCALAAEIDISRAEPAVLGTGSLIG